VTELTDRIARLEAVEAIKILKARYARACDPVPDGELIASMFTEDGVFDCGELFGVHHGREAIGRHFARGPEVLKWALHLIGSPIVEVAGDLRTATGSWYLWQPMTTLEPDGSAQARWLCGEYHDTYACDEQGTWRFASVRLDIGIYAAYERGWEPVLSGAPSDEEVQR
jgi:SnoaL-like protein